MGGNSMSATMRALVLDAHGTLDNLKIVEDKPIPKAVPGHVVIRVKASSFNNHDVFTVRGMPGIKVPLPVVIGLDMAGEITEIGDGVSGWKKGDRVLVNPLNKKKGLLGEMMDGGMAEYCMVDAEQLIHMPDGVSYEDAASLPVAYGTAHRMIITHHTVKKGDRVLVLGASGGVGTGCVLLAKHRVEQQLRRQSGRSVDAERREEAAPGRGQGSAARQGSRVSAAHREPRSDGQGRLHDLIPVTHRNREGLEKM